MNERKRDRRIDEREKKRERGSDTFAPDGQRKKENKCTVERVLVCVCVYV